MSMIGEGRAGAIGRSGWALIRSRRRSPRWPYVVLALLAFPFVGHAFEDGGAFYGAIYATITVVGVAQAVWPTALGWGVVLTAFMAYGAAGVPGYGPLWYQALMAVLTLGVIWGAFWFLRPWKRWPNRPASSEPKAEDA